MSISDVRSGIQRVFSSPHWLAALAIASWLLVVLVEYWNLPLVDMIPFFGSFISLGVRILAVLATIAVTRCFIQRRSYVAATLAVVAVVVSGYYIGTTDWRAVYIDTQFELHRSDFAELAEAHDSGVIAGSTQLPLAMRYFSLDGMAHLRTPIEQGKGYIDEPDVLYIPVWQNWRAENGFGLAHFRFSAEPGSEIELMTAAGDFGEPVRYLGGGWWLVDEGVLKIRRRFSCAAGFLGL